MPRALPPRLSAGVVVPALLFAGIAVATLLFARSYRSEGRTAKRDTTAAMARSPAISPDDSAAAARAHAAAGVPPGGDNAAAIFHERVQALQKRLAAEPGRRDLVLQLAQLLRDGHRARDAVPYYRKAIRMDSLDAHPYYDLASVYAGLAEWSQAADLLQRRLRMSPSDAVALYDLGAVRANQGRASEARTLFEKARAATSDTTLRARITSALARLTSS